MKKIMRTFLITILLAIVAFFALGWIKIPQSIAMKYCMDSIQVDHTDQIDELTDALLMLQETNDDLKAENKMIIETLQKIEKSLIQNDTNTDITNTPNQFSRTNNQQLEDASQTADLVEENQ